ncbi:MAG TPA: cytochrome c, partial [Polyangiaceae bacterium]|nr:cytochrome c [Polyangiaceae bacterium]
VFTLACGALGACRSEPREATPSAASKPAVHVEKTRPPAQPSVAPAAAGDAAHGKTLVQKYECSRCHDGTGVPSAPLEQHCLHCHQDILAGKFKASPEKLSKWQKNVTWVRDIPSLAATGARFRATWIERFLQQPHDLRPALAQSMPRLEISPSDARDIAAYLTAGAAKGAPSAVPSGDLTQGRELFETKGCGSCHRFSGVGQLATTPRLDGPVDQQRAASLAPDLRHTRERFRPEQIVRWILAPKSLKPDTLMPTSPLNQQEASELAHFILSAPLAPAAVKAVPSRLPVLTRKVTFEEVNERVLAKTCRHCHGNPDVALGDGGPGNTGGFGFAPRRLNLASYSGVAAGLLDAQQQRMSVFAKTSDGTPRLVAALLARQAEEAGKPNPEVRGMPLGLPSLPADDVQLVETWIAQGRPK